MISPTQEVTKQCWAYLWFVESGNGTIQALDLGFPQNFQMPNQSGGYVSNMLEMNGND